MRSEVEVEGDEHISALSLQVSNFKRHEENVMQNNVLLCVTHYRDES